MYEIKNHYLYSRTSVYRYSMKDLHGSLCSVANIEILDKV